MANPVVLCILDGWGTGDGAAGNAPQLAQTPHFDRLMATQPNAQLITHGPDVGLPSGQMGNSEVGHTNIGAGRVVAMDLGQIDLALEDGSYARNTEILNFAEVLKATNGTAHLLGLVSDGGVHGHINHINATIDLLTGLGVPTVLHAISDGRDVAPRSAQDFFDQLSPNAKIATLTGRYYALDRDNRWERVVTAFDAMALGQGPRADTANDAITALDGKEVLARHLKADIRPDRVELAGMASELPGSGQQAFFLHLKNSRIGVIARFERMGQVYVGLAHEACS